MLIYVLKKLLIDIICCLPLQGGHGAKSVCENAITCMDMVLQVTVHVHTHRLLCSVGVAQVEE